MLPAQDAGHRSSSTDVEDGDREAVITSEQEGGHVHHVQLPLDHLVERQAIEPHGVRIRPRIRAVDPVDPVLRREQRVGAELDVYEWATTFEIMRGAELPYNAFTFTWFTTTADADYTMYANYHSEETPPNSWNRWRYANEKVDALLEQARASLDPQERLDAYAEVQEILAQDVASVPLYNSLETAVVNSAVDGYVAHPIQYILDLYPVSINR